MPKRPATAPPLCILIVLFVPSFERDGVTPIDQEGWVGQSLDLLGGLFGGATAYPKGRGVWRDDERGGVLIRDEVITVHSYADPALVADPRCFQQIADFCRRMLREANQGEVAVIVDDGMFKFKPQERS